jgi:hypothetical protein
LPRDFESQKQAIISHLKTYFPNDIQDFNESSVGMMFVEIGAYVGDAFNFYLDKRFNESFTETANETKNIFKHAKQLGFKAFGKTAAVGFVDAFLRVPARNNLGKIEPNMNFAGKVKRGAKLKSKSGNTYETLEQIDFSKVDINDPNFTQVAERNAQTSEPTTFVLKVKDVYVKAGETRSTTFTVGDYVRFRELTLSDDDVLEIIKIIDSDGNQWFEVDYLAQDTVFESTVNSGANADTVPYVLKLRSVPFRFISEFDFSTGKTSITFGSGDAQSFDGELIPDLGDLSLPVFGKDTFTDFALDPQNFLKTRTLGLTPVNTTLTVQYRVGGGFDSNAGTGEIDNVVEKSFEVSDSSLPIATVRDVANSFSVLNSSPIIGGNDELEPDEIKHLIPAQFAAQSRLVNAPDFIARALSMPARFGSVFRANARLNPLNRNSLELIVLSLDNNGHCVPAPAQLKQNLKTYLSRFRMMTDGIEILDGKIINLGLNFSILTSPDFNKLEVLANCIEILKQALQIKHQQLNQPINISDLYVLLKSVPGVISLIDIQFANLVGTIEGRQYSTSKFNVNQNLRNGILYSEDNAIFEIKNPDFDIKRSCQVNGLSKILQYSRYMDYHR